MNNTFFPFFPPHFGDHSSFNKLCRRPFIAQHSAGKRCVHLTQTLISSFRAKKDEDEERQTFTCSLKVVSVSHQTTTLKKL
jgi:hypothetical protein